MPHLTAIIGEYGPVIQVQMGVSDKRAAVLKLSSHPVPQPVSCNLLIDTGASMTCIDRRIVKSLGLTPTGNIFLHTSSTGDTPHSCDAYDASMVISGGGVPKTIAALPVIENNFGASGIDGLLGRDILMASRLIYSGYDNSIMLSIV